MNKWKDNLNNLEKTNENTILMCSRQMKRMDKISKNKVKKHVFNKPYYILIKIWITLTYLKDWIKLGLG